MATEGLYNWLVNLNEPRKIVFILVLAILSIVGLQIRSNYIGKAPDAMWHPTESDHRAFFCSESESGNETDTLERDLHDQCRNQRTIYVVTQLTLDVLFPFAYATLLGIFIVKFFAPSIAKTLIWLPLFTCLADLSENLMLVYVALTFDCDQSLPEIANIASWVTSIKWSLGVMSMLVLAIGWIHWKRQESIS